MLTLTAPTMPARNQIAALEAAMKVSDHQIQIEPTHRFAQGLYAREVTLPAGSTAVGHIHAQEHICVVSKGRALVVSEAGTIEIEAPCTMIIPAGRKNCVHAIEETVWTTIHATETRDIDALESELLLPSYPDEATPCLS